MYPATKCWCSIVFLYVYQRVMDLMEGWAYPKGLIPVLTEFWPTRLTSLPTNRVEISTILQYSNVAIGYLKMEVWMGKSRVWDFHCHVWLPLPEGIRTCRFSGALTFPPTCLFQMTLVGCASSVPIECGSFPQCNLQSGVEIPPISVSANHEMV